LRNNVARVATGCAGPFNPNSGYLLEVAMKSLSPVRLPDRAVRSVAVGIVVLRESADARCLLSAGLIVAGVIGLNLTTPE
jgi:hypothetical protein